MDLPRINGLDLFSGIGGISIALSPWVRTVAYCEQDRYAQSVLLSRMSEGKLHRAPIWDDVQTLTGKMLPPIDIIAGGFPCQDISVAGNGAGLEGKRSGLFFEIIRLTREIHPSFVFLENVPAIRTRGLDQVIKSFTEIGYDCRWTCLSASSVGAPHKRERWFLLAYANGATIWDAKSGGSSRISTELRDNGEKESLAHSNCVWKSSSPENGNEQRDGVIDRSQALAYAGGERFQRFGSTSRGKSEYAESCFSGWWTVEPNVGRVANGVPLRSHRIKCLGNSVVPKQVQTAFRVLSGIGEE